MILKIAQQLAPKEEGQPSHIGLMRVSASDISSTAVDMSLINFTMWGIPAEVKYQNTLSLETWAHHKNFHWHRVGEDERQKSIGMYRKMKELLTAPVSEPTPSEAPRPIQEQASIHPPLNEGKREQGEFNF